MAAVKLRLLGQTFCLLILVSASASSTQDYAELIARLYRQAVRNNKPLVVVLDQTPKAQQELQYSSSSNEEVSGLGSLLKQLQQSYHQQRVRPIAHEHGRYHNYEKYPKYSTQNYKPKKRDHRFRNLLQQYVNKRDRYPSRQLHQPKYQEQRFKNDDNILGPKNVVKSLLNLRNSLSCNAQDQCKRGCRNNYLRTSAKKCVIKCEITFVCNQPDAAKPDDCEESDDCKSADSCAEGDDCGDDANENPSTRAPPEIDTCEDANVC